MVLTGRAAIRSSVSQDGAALLAVARSRTPSWPSCLRREYPPGKSGLDIPQGGSHGEDYPRADLHDLRGQGDIAMAVHRHQERARWDFIEKAVFGGSEIVAETGRGDRGLWPAGKGRKNSSPRGLRRCIFPGDANRLTRTRAAEVLEQFTAGCIQQEGRTPIPRDQPRARSEDPRANIMKKLGARETARRSGADRDD